jgi:co-chaperonin GroES (HSP10)
VTSEVQPLRDYVYLESFPDGVRGEDIVNEARRRLILPPDVSKEPSRLARVLAVGEGYRNGAEIIPLDVKVGEVVLCPRYGGAKAISDGEEFFFMRESEILARVDL